MARAKPSNWRPGGIECSAYLAVDVPKAHQTSDWRAPTLSRGQLAYAAADAVLCHRLWERTACDLKARGRDRAYRLQRDCLAAAAAMELRGVAIDLDAHAALCDRWATTSPTRVELDRGDGQSAAEQARRHVAVSRAGAARGRALAVAAHQHRRAQHGYR